jgi:antitoxin MazE
MRTALQRLGKSRGIIIPDPIIAQLGFRRSVELVVQGDALVIRNPKYRPRAGWAEASRALAELNDDELVW